MMASDCMIDSNFSWAFEYSFTKVDTSEWMFRTAIMKFRNERNLRNQNLNDNIFINVQPTK